MDNNFADKFNYGVALSGRCFEMKQVSEDTILLRCSFFSRAKDKNDKSKGYIQGQPINVKCRVQGDHCTEIVEQDYTNKNVTVWGRFYVTNTHSDKTNQDYVNLYIDADKVEETQFKKSSGGGNGGSWGNNG